MCKGHWWERRCLRVLIFLQGCSCEWAVFRHCVTLVAFFKIFVLTFYQVSYCKDNLLSCLTTTTKREIAIFGSISRYWLDHMLFAKSHLCMRVCIRMGCLHTCEVRADLFMKSLRLVWVEIAGGNGLMWNILCDSVGGHLLQIMDVLMSSWGPKPTAGYSRCTNSGPLW